MIKFLKRVPIVLRKVFNANRSYNNGIRALELYSAYQLNSNSFDFESAPSRKRLLDIMVSSRIIDHDLIAIASDNSLSEAGIEENALVLLRNIDDPTNIELGNIVGISIQDSEWVYLAEVKDIKDQSIDVEFQSADGEQIKRQVKSDDIRYHAVKTWDPFEFPTRDRGPYNRSLVYLQ